MQSISTTSLGSPSRSFKCGLSSGPTPAVVEEPTLRPELRAVSRASCTLVGIDQEFLASRALGVDGEIDEIERLRQ